MCLYLLSLKYSDDDTTHTAYKNSFETEDMCAPVPQLHLPLLFWF